VDWTKVQVVIAYPKAMPMPRPIAALLLIILATPMADAKAEIHWCSISDQGSSNCSFISVDQCLATVSGLGGYCMREAQLSDGKPRAADSSTSEAKRPVKNQRRYRNSPIDIHICRGC
jgi:hypothetical protein